MIVPVFFAVCNELVHIHVIGRTAVDDAAGRMEQNIHIRVRHGPFYALCLFFARAN